MIYPSEVYSRTENMDPYMGYVIPYPNIPNRGPWKM